MVPDVDIGTKRNTNNLRSESVAEGISLAQECNLSEPRAPNFD